VRADVALTTKLLRHANSAETMQARALDSIRDALVLLGAEGVRRIAALASIAGLGPGGGSPQQLVISSVVRARFCESLARVSTLGAPRFDLFLLGMFSMVDAILGLPMERAVGDLPVSSTVRGALVHGEGRIGAVLRLDEAQERASWEEFQGIAAVLRLDLEQVTRLYVEAVEWANRVFAEAKAA